MERVDPVRRGGVISVDDRFNDGIVELGTLGPANCDSLPEDVAGYVGENFIAEDALRLEQERWKNAHCVVAKLAPGYGTDVRHRNGIG